MTTMGNARRAGLGCHGTAHTPGEEIMRAATVERRMRVQLEGAGHCLCLLLHVACRRTRRSRIEHGAPRAAMFSLPCPRRVQLPRHGGRTVPLWSASKWPPSCRFICGPRAMPLRATPPPRDLISTQSANSSEPRCFPPESPQSPIARKGPKARPTNFVSALMCIKFTGGRDGWSLLSV